MILNTIKNVLCISEGGMGHLHYVMYFLSNYTMIWFSFVQNMITFSLAQSVAGLASNLWVEGLNFGLFSFSSH